MVDDQATTAAGCGRPSRVALGAGYATSGSTKDRPASFGENTYDDGAGSKACLSIRPPRRRNRGLGNLCCKTGPLPRAFCHGMFVLSYITVLNAVI